MHGLFVKHTRRLLIGVILLTAAAVAINYFQTWRRRSNSGTKPPQILDSQMKRSAKEVEYIEYRGIPRIPRFKIHAKIAHETQAGRNLLEGIEACDFNPDGSIRNEIRSQRAEYDPAGKIADFSGEVRLFINKQIELQTESLHYDLNTETGTTSDLMRFLSRQMSGTARGLRFEQKQRSLALLDQVDLNLIQSGERTPGAGISGNVHATAQRAYCSEQFGRILFEGDALLVSETQTLSGDRIEALLDPDHKRINSLTALGKAAYVSKTPEESRALGGDRLVFGINEGILRNLSVFGQASFSSSAPSETQELHAQEIDVSFDEKENPTQIKARKSVTFQNNREAERITMSGEQLDAVFAAGTKNLQLIQIRKRDGVSDPARLTLAGGNANGSELQADDIRMSLRQLGGRSVLDRLRAEGTARYISRPKQNGSAAEPARSLSASLLELNQSAAGDYLESGSAAGKVLFSEDSTGSTERPQLKRLLADRSTFQFFSGNNVLRHLDADGNVQVVYEKAGGIKSPAVEKFRTSSSKMSAEFGFQSGKSVIESVVQSGNFTYDDGTRAAASGRCDYDAGKQILVLTESPRVSDESKSTTGDRIEYDQVLKVLWVKGHVRSKFGSRKGSGSFFASGPSSPAVVTADEMRYWTDSGKAIYSSKDGSKVFLLSENQDLQAQTLEISGGLEKVDAIGSVRHLVAKKEGDDPVKGAASDLLTVIRSSSMTYLKGKNRIIYSGKVTLHSGEVDLSADSLEAIPDSSAKKIQQATARGGVSVQYGSRQCKGDMADYFMDSRKFVVTGQPAEFYDPNRGRSYARRLTSTTADDTILLEK